MAVVGVGLTVLPYNANAASHKRALSDHPGIRWWALGAHGTTASAIALPLEGHGIGQARSTS